MLSAMHMVPKGGLFVRQVGASDNVYVSAPGSWDVSGLAPDPVHKAGVIEVRGVWDEPPHHLLRIKTALKPIEFCDSTGAAIVSGLLWEVACKLGPAGWTWTATVHILPTK